MSCEEQVRRLVEEVLRFYGYSDEQIALANKDNPHISECEFDTNHQCWVCTDENGKSFHPEWDEAYDVAGIISRVLEAVECLCDIDGAAFVSAQCPQHGIPRLKQGTCPNCQLAWHGNSPCVLAV